jgi:hypothetical protein
MLIALSDTDSAGIAAEFVRARMRAGSPAMGMVLTMVIVAPEEQADTAMEMAREASHEHPARVLGVILGPRLEKELLGNVSIKLFETGSPDVIEVAGRGELQLAVLIEAMRREGYELQVSRPEVITKEVNGKRFEPQERGVCDVPDEHVGTVTQELAPRKGRITDLRSGDAGRTIVTFECPSRGLIGFRSLTTRCAPRKTSISPSSSGNTKPDPGAPSPNSGVYETVPPLVSA